jgi:hypothetical protein
LSQARQQQLADDDFAAVDRVHDARDQCAVVRIDARADGRKLDAFVLDVLSIAFAGRDDGIVAPHF